jgi:hypothetical protein
LLLNYPLNSASAQFIFEMVQNIDDTPHSDKNKRPSLSFVLSHYDPRTCADLSEPILMVLSQQDGFTRKDIESICSIADGRNSSQIEDSGCGPSTNDLSTGEKGIGFKSVSSIYSVICTSSFCRKPRFHNFTITQVFAVSSEPFIYSTYRER